VCVCVCERVCVCVMDDNLIYEVRSKYLACSFSLTSSK